MSTPEPLMAIPDVAAYLGVSERFVRRLVEERRVPHKKIGKFIRFRRADLDAYIEACSVDGNEWKPSIVRAQRSVS